VDFNLSEEQVLLEGRHHKLILKEYSFEQRRRYGVTPEGWSRTFWGAAGTGKLPGAAVSRRSTVTRQWPAGADACNGSSGSCPRAGAVLRKACRRGSILRHGASETQLARLVAADRGG